MDNFKNGLESQWKYMNKVCTYNSMKITQLLILICQDKLIPKWIMEGAGGKGILLQNFIVVSTVWDLQHFIFQDFYQLL